LFSIVIWFLNDECKKILKDIGHDLSLVFVQNLNSADHLENKENNCSVLVKGEKIFKEKNLYKKRVL